MLVYVLFGDFAPFCLDSDVSGESVFAGEEFEEFQGQQGKSFIYSPCNHSSEEEFYSDADGVED